MRSWSTSTTGAGGRAGRGCRVVVTGPANAGWWLGASLHCMGGKGRKNHAHLGIRAKRMRHHCSRTGCPASAHAPARVPACPTPSRRLLNLELLLKFGSDAWRMHNDVLASVLKQLQQQMVATRGQIEGLNRERKLQQTAAGEPAGRGCGVLGLLDVGRQLAGQPWGGSWQGSPGAAGWSSAQ